MTVEQKAEEYKETVHRWRDSKGELAQEEDVKQAFQRRLNRYGI